jgi:hypothetical protein
VAIRTEDGIEKAVILRPTFGQGVQQKVRHVGGKPSAFQLADERPAEMRR